MKPSSVVFAPQRSAAIAASVALALSGAPSPIAARAAATPAGAIEVVSVPAAATVWLDGSYFGPTPLHIGAIPAGRHVITLTKAGYVTQEFSCDVTPDTLEFAARRLPEAAPAKPRRTGRVVFHGRYDPASVRIDGIAPAHATVSPGRPGPPDGEIGLVTGTHVVRVVIDGVPVERKFDVVADTRTVLALDVPDGEGDADRSARLVAPVDTTLPDATVTIEGTKLVVRNGNHVAVGRLADPVMRIDGETVRADPPPMRAGKHVFLPTPIFDRLRRIGPAVQPHVSEPAAGG